MTCDHRTRPAGGRLKDESLLSNPKRATNRFLLRAATRHEHLAAETTWTPEHGFGSVERYHGFLRALVSVHLQLGLPAATKRGIASEIALEEARIEALADDLRLPIKQNRGGHDMCVSYAWGVAYCLNGSALGASVMLKSVHLPENWPRTYLLAGRDYVRSGGLVSFFSLLDSMELDLDAAADGAKTVFRELAASAAG